MTLTEPEKQRILELFEQMIEEERAKNLASQTAFRNWFSTKLPDLYRKIKDSIQSVLNWLRERFK